MRRAEFPLASTNPDTEGEVDLGRAVAISKLMGEWLSEEVLILMGLGDEPKANQRLDDSCSMITAFLLGGVATQAALISFLWSKIDFVILHSFVSLSNSL